MSFAFLVSLLASQIQKDDKVYKNNNLSIHSVVQLGIHRRTDSGGNSVGADQYGHYRGGSSANARREREEEDMAIKLEFKTEVARALWRLAEDRDSNSKRIIDTKGLLLLAKFIEKEIGEVQGNCLKALMEIAAAAERDLDLMRAAFKTSSPAAKAVVEQLLRVVEEGTPNLQIPAVKAIGCLAHTFPAKESRIIKPLVKQLGHREASVAAEAATALQKFAHPTNFLHTEHSKGIISSGGSTSKPVFIADCGQL